MVVLLAAGWASAASLTLPPTADTYLNINTTINASATTLNLYTWPANRIGNAILLQFDLRAIPAGSTVSTATLTLRLTQADAQVETTYTVTAHRLLRSANLVLATGYTADGATPWTPNACCYNGIPMAQADIGPAIATFTVDKTLGVKTWDIAALVQEWVAAPGQNYGLLLNSDATKGAGRFRTFASREHATLAWRPSLTVVYVAGMPIPPDPVAIAPVVTFTRIWIIELAWDDNSPSPTNPVNEDGFYVYRRVPPGAYSRRDQVGQNVTTFTDRGLDPTLTYCYQVSAFTGSQESVARTNEVCSQPK